METSNSELDAWARTFDKNHMQGRFPSYRQVV